MRLLFTLSLVAPALAARFAHIQLSGEKWCVQTKNESTEIGGELEYGECGNGPTQRWSYVNNQLQLFGERDRCLGIKDQKAILVACTPTNDKTVETSWTWDMANVSPICTSKSTQVRMQEPTYVQGDPKQSTRRAVKLTSHQTMMRMPPTRSRPGACPLSEDRNPLCSSSRGGSALLVSSRCAPARPERLEATTSAVMLLLRSRGESDKVKCGSPLSVRKRVQ